MEEGGVAGVPGDAMERKGASMGKRVPIRIDDGYDGINLDGNI